MSAGPEKQKHTLNFYRGDIEKLRDMHPDVPPSVVIRELVHKHIARVEAQIQPTNLKVEIEL